MNKSSAEIHLCLKGIRAEFQKLPVIANGGLKVAPLLRLDAINENLLRIGRLSRGGCEQGQEGQNCCNCTHEIKHSAEWALQSPGKLATITRKERMADDHGRFRKNSIYSKSATG